MRQFTASNATELQHSLGQSAAGDVIVVLPGSYGKPSLLINKTASREAPIRIVFAGEGWIDGTQSPDHLWRRPPPGKRYGDEGYPAPKDDSPPKPNDNDFAFLQIVKCRHVSIEGLKIRHCWPSIFYIKDSSHIVIRGGEFEGATYAIFAKGEKTSHLLIEDNVWRQDASAEHELWSRLSWVEAHGGERGGGTSRQFNGGFVSTRNIRGDVVVRGNLIADCYNGIRMKADPPCEQPARQGLLNSNVHIYDNTFLRNRDNPVELEGFAHDWHIRHNRLVDCHSWFSFDGTKGGIWYVYGNVGTFETRQGIPPNSEEDRKQRHTMGRVLKLSYLAWKNGSISHELAGVPCSEWYVAHNSWFLRCPIIGGANARLPDQAPGPDPFEGPDRTARLRFLNNAFEWAQAPSEDNWTSVSVDPLDGTSIPPVQNFDFVNSPDCSFDYSLWYGPGWPDHGTPAFAPKDFEHNGFRSQTSLFAGGFLADLLAPGGGGTTSFALVADSKGRSSAAPLSMRVPAGAPVAFRANPDGRLHRGAVQDYGLVSAPSLEARAEEIIADMRRAEHLV